MNWLLRRIGIKAHKWRSIHRSGYTIECVHCGEQRQAYQSNFERPPQWNWWETDKDGDGSCWGEPLPRKLEWY